MRGRSLAGVVGVALLAASAARAAEEENAAERRALAEALVVAREAVHGRAYDARYRAALVERLAADSGSRRHEMLAAGAERAAPAGTRLDDATPAILGANNQDLVYNAVTPCRVVDTRVAGGALAGGTQRSFRVAGVAGFPGQGGAAGGCGIPFPEAKAAIVNIVSVTPAGAGNLRAFAFATPLPAAPFAAVLNYGVVFGLPAVANGIAVPICDAEDTTCTHDLVVQADVSATHVVIDVLGYFTAGKRNVTRLSYNGTDSDGTIGGTFELLRTVGVFTKVSAATGITTVWSAHVHTTGTFGTSFCHYQVRIDGVNGDGGSGPVNFLPFHVIEKTDFWAGLAAGSHTVSIWVRGNATACGANYGDFTQSVLVVEH
jgi:hypothetical protein